MKIYIHKWTYRMWKVDKRIFSLGSVAKFLEDLQEKRERMGAGLTKLKINKSRCQNVIFPHHEKSLVTSFIFLSFFYLFSRDGNKRHRTIV